MPGVEFLLSFQDQLQVIKHSMQRRQVTLYAPRLRLERPRRQKGVINADPVLQVLGEGKQTLLDEVKVARIGGCVRVVSLQLQQADGGAGVAVQRQVFDRHHRRDVDGDACVGFRCKRNNNLKESHLHDAVRHGHRLVSARRYLHRLSYNHKDVILAV